MSTIGDSQLSNKDLAPTGPERRTWGTYRYGPGGRFALSALTYVALARVQQAPAPSPATAD